MCRAATRLELRAVFVANSFLTLPRSPFVSTVRVGQGLDVADNHIVAAAAKGDVAITADLPLAAALVRKGVTALDSRGTLYTEENVEERLSIRNFMQDLRDSGVQTGGPRAFDARTRQQFANALDRVLGQVVRARSSSR